MIFIAGMEKKSKQSSSRPRNRPRSSRCKWASNMASCPIINLFDENLVVINNENKIN